MRIEYVSKYVGESVENIRSLFEEAEEAASTVLFLDKIDALAAERGSGTDETRSQRQVVNELLQRMQDIQSSDILVIAATNRKGDLDDAVTRSERFNQEFFVGALDPSAREEILDTQLDKKGREVDWQSIEWPHLVEWTQEFSAANLSAVVRKATRLSAEESTQKGELVPVNYRHLLETVKEVEPSGEQVVFDEAVQFGHLNVRETTERRLQVALERRTALDTSP